MIVLLDRVGKMRPKKDSKMAKFFFERSESTFFSRFARFEVLANFQNDFLVTLSDLQMRPVEPFYPTLCLLFFSLEICTVKFF